jgi:hypothetical protein
MPPRGYRDEFKRWYREIVPPERVALQKAASGREHDLSKLVKISILQDREGLTAHAAARKIADEIGGNARLRHANTKRLYAKFQKAAALYRRLALASCDPVDAADREICEEYFKNWSVKLTPFSRSKE